MSIDSINKNFVHNSVDSKKYYYDNLATNEKSDGVTDKISDDKTNDTPSVETKGLIDSDSTACYDRNIFQPERRGELLERMLSSMSKAEHSEKIVEYDEELGREIYAFSIYDGKVHVSGNEGFEYKAMTYEQLINASLNKSWNCLFKGAIVEESRLIDTVNGILKYYMDIDSDYRRNNKSDSITNHVDEAFQKWCDNHKQREIHFDGKA